MGPGSRGKLVYEAGKKRKNLKKENLVFIVSLAGGASLPVKLDVRGGPPMKKGSCLKIGMIAC